MTPRNGLETLSLEIFDEIVADLSAHDKFTLSEVSHSLHSRIIPQLYSSWQFLGYSQSFKSLHCFLRTVLENPELASYVRTVDIRDWGGKTPRPEDYIRTDCPREELDDRTVRALENAIAKPPEQRARFDEEVEKAGDESIYLDEGGSDDEEDRFDEDVDADEDIAPDEIDELMKEARLDLATAPAEVINPDYYQIWQKLDFIEDLIVHKTHKSEDIILGLILAELPNVETLYMVKPEEYNEIPALVAKGEVPILRNLRTIYLASSLSK